MTFRSPGNRTSHVERGRMKIGAWGGPSFETKVLRFQSGDRSIDPRQLGRIDLGEGRRPVTLPIRLGAGQLAHESDEVLLQVFKLGSTGSVRTGRLGETDGRVELVESPDGLDLRMVFWYALSVEQTRRAVISPTGGNG